MKSVVLGSLLVAASISLAGFSKGDRFQYANIEGSLTIQCTNKTKTVICRDVFMDPWPYDIFLGPRSGRASQVELRATVGNETQSTVAGYDGNSGRSAEINLGVYSLFQKPLLKVGENKVRYVILDKSNNVIDTNSFQVTVTRGRSRACDPKETSAPSQQDCDHPYSLCQIYFRSQNYCR